MSNTGRLFEGNALYIQGKLEEAIEKYVEATVIDDTDPTPVQTLLSANYELGNYKKCIETISEALKLEKDTTKVLALRLREAKCYFYKRQFSEAEDVLLEHCNTSDPEVQRLLKAIENYIRYPGDDAVWEEVLRIPRIRPSLTPHLTTFAGRHDDPVAPFSDKELAILASKGVQDLDIFYGGIGDGRHFFQQLNHIYAYGKKEETPTTTGKKATKGKFTFILQDYKPETMARMLVLLCLLYQTSDAMRIGDDKEQRFLEMVIVYVYACDIMPPYCEAHIMAVIRDLLQSANTGNNFGIRWLSVDEESKAKICKVLRFWVEDHSNLPGAEFTVESAQRWFMGDLDDEALEKVRQLGPEAIDELNQFSTTRMLFPLQELIHEREPKLAQLITKKPEDWKYKLALYGKKNWCMNITLLQDPEHLRFLRSVFGQRMGHISTHIGGYVKEIWQQAMDQLPYKLLRTRPKIDWVLPRSETEFSLVQFVMPWFAPCARVFRNEWFDSKVQLRVGDATHHLDSLRFSRDKATFDAIYLSNIPDYIGGHLATILYALPTLKKSTNIGGVSSYVQTNMQINTVAFKNGYIDTTAEYLCLPDLQAANLYTGLDLVLTEPIRKLRNEVQQHGTPMWVLLSEPHRWSLQKPPKLPDKPNAIRWIYRMFFKIALPAPRKGPQGWTMNPSARLEQPLTLSTFLRLCIYLVESLDYPEHWISNVLDTMLQTGRILTTAKPPSAAPLDLAEVSLISENSVAIYDIRPFLSELRALSIQYLSVFPFPLVTELPSHAYLRKYSVRLHCHPTNIGTEGNLLTLVLFHPNKKKNLHHRNWLWKQIVHEDTKDIVDPELAIVSCLKWTFNIETPVSDNLLDPRGPKYSGVAEWVMEEGEIEKMKKWGWAIGMARTDNWTIFTNTVMMKDGVKETGMEF